MVERSPLDCYELGAVDYEILEHYEKSNHQKKLFVISMIFLIMAVGLVSITIGPLSITVQDCYQVILSNVFPGIESNLDTIINNTVWEVRLPRVLAGIFVGFGLAISGAVMQPVLKNPMASPFTLGLSSAAAFGACVAIAASINNGTSTISTIVGAFICSMLSLLIIMALSMKKNTAPEVVILTGIAISYLFNAGTIMIQYFVDPIYTKQMTFWSAGSLYKSNWDTLKIIVPVVVIVSLLLIIKSKDLNAISAGDEVAKSIGINVDRTRKQMMIGATFMTATLISFMGIIGFIGLVAPHIVRMIIGGDNRYVVITSGFVGGLLLVISDIVAMNVMAPVTLPIGVITTAMGVPLFLYLIGKRQKRGGA